MRLNLATEKKYKHTIFSIADPLIKNHIEQAINACKFRLKFPAFYDFMVRNRFKIKCDLFVELEKIYLLNRVEITQEELEQDIECILEERRFLDNAIGFIQTGHLLQPDIFLVSHGLPIGEIKQIYSRISSDFWNAVESQLYINTENSGKDKVLSYLNENELYLPNLFLWLDFEKLLLDFLPIHLSYGRFQSSEAPKSLAKLPTKSVSREILKPLLLYYPSPLFFESSSHIDYSTQINEMLTSTHFVLQMSLNEHPENLPYILRNFLIGYQSRRLDFMLKGSNQEYDTAQTHELENLRGIASEILSVLDKFSNQRLGNRKEIHSLGYLAVLNAVLALTFIKFHCDQIFKGNNLIGIDLGDTDHLIFNNTNITLNDEKLAVSFSSTYEFFIENLVKVLLTSDQLHVSVSPPNRGKRKITSIEITLIDKIENTSLTSKKEKPQYLEINVASLKKAIKEFVKKRIPEAECLI